jgi:hypothetical protein
MYFKIPEAEKQSSQRLIFFHSTGSKKDGLGRKEERILLISRYDNLIDG